MLRQPVGGRTPRDRLSICVAQDGQKRGGVGGIFCAAVVEMRTNLVVW
jgi:hypothetical protein